MMPDRAGIGLVKASELFVNRQEYLFAFEHVAGLIVKGYKLAPLGFIEHWHLTAATPAV
jgi:hypothetical protein